MSLQIDRQGFQPGPPGGDSRYQHYWEEMPCYLSVNDREFRIIDGNRLFRRDFGDRIGQLCYEVYKNRDEVCPNCPVEETFADGVGHGSEQVLTTTDGKEVPVTVRTTPIRDENGEVVAVMEMHTEISDIKRLQDELQHSQAAQARLFEEAPCFITVQGPDMRIRRANRRFRETFGEAAGKNCYKVYKHREEQCMVCPTQLTFADGKTREHEEVLVSATGEKLNVLCTTAPLRNTSGEIESVIEMGTDISQLRELQSQLTSIGLLVGSIAHGIKGLLSGLDGGIYLVDSGFATDNQGRVKRGWEMVQRNVARIRSMVLDILYYAKDRELTLVDVDLAELVEEVRGGLSKKAGDLQIDLQIDIPRDLGTFPADTNAIRSVLLNLLENSLDACRADRQKEQHIVGLSARRGKTFVVLEVKDNGIGMDRETREKVFSLFFSSKGMKGTGLGLFISNKIVDKHGGSISLESEPGQGTTFTIRLPLEAKPSIKPEGE